MNYTTSPPWTENLVLSATAVRSGRATEFYRAARAGRFVRLAEGVFLPVDLWESLSADARYLARVHAVALASRPGLVFSHYSAAALWRLPIIGAWPARPEVTVGAGAIGQARAAFTARRYEIPDRLDHIDGLAVTPLARTLIDIGRSAPLSVSVPMMDRALAPKRTGPAVELAQLGMAELTEEFTPHASARGRTRCRLAIELADGRSGSAGESVSRVGMHALALPSPTLQQAFYDSQGQMVVDFWWPQFNLIGEFDGVGKYLRKELLAGQSTADAVLAEKRREDRLRALGPRVTRWGWDTALSLPRLAGHLRDAGLT